MLCTKCLTLALVLGAERVQSWKFTMPMKPRANPRLKVYKKIMAKKTPKAFVASTDSINWSWFDSFDQEVRRKHVEDVCRDVFRSDEGQPSIVISYPREGGLVKAYDLDTGAIFSESMDYIRKAEKIRKTGPSDYHYSAVLQSRYTNEADDITTFLFP